MLANQKSKRVKTMENIKVKKTGGRKKKWIKCKWEGNFLRRQKKEEA